MKEIFKEFIEGSSTKKLSIVSDFSTILGVSVATIVAGPFLSKFTSQEFIVSDFIITVLFTFLCIYLAIDAIYDYCKYVINAYNESKYADIVQATVISTLILWAVVVSFPYIKHLVGNAFNVSYLLPLTAEKAVTDIELISSNSTDGLFTIEGIVHLSDDANHEDYVITAYMKKSSGVYQSVKFSKNSDWEFEGTLNKTGRYSLPLSIDTSPSQLYLVVYRESDWSFFNFVGINQTGFPNGMTQLPSNETDELKAFVKPFLF